jgi:peptidoglycan/LPS O-acetylase OafA/YrhL
VERLIANLFFYANLPPARLFHGGEHLWSLAVEMQFYVGAALLVGLAGVRGLLLLPLIGLAVTAARIWAGETISIVTWHRVDEILAGATLALAHMGKLGPFIPRMLRLYPLWLAVVVAALCCYFVSTPLAYLRPYAVAAMVGASLYAAPPWFSRAMTSQPAVYIAEISFALYVFHAMLAATWLGSGDLLTKYLKRPLLFAATFGLAHLSTFHFEQRFIRLAKRLTTTARLPGSRTAPLPSASGEVGR